MTDIVVPIGRRRLFGVLSLPDAQPWNAPPVLIPNTGMEHRVGPNRLHVQMCRALASAGIPALRVDLAGFGDSHADGELNSTRDLQDAIDELSKRGYGEQVVGVGLCSGAHDVHQLAKVDQRVVGAAFIDGYAYATRLFRVNYLLQRISDPARIFRHVHGRLASRGQLERGELEDEKENFDPDEAEYVRQPSRQQMAEDLQEFMRRRLALMYVYTGQVQHQYNYRGQLLSAFPSLRAYDRLTLHYLVHADHTFSRTQMRSHMIATLLRWLLKSSAPSSSVAPLARHA
jgi:hypothetical protein